MRSVRGSSKAWSNLKSKRPSHKPMKCYETRKGNLHDVGYTLYKEYLASDEWMRIRKRVLGKHPFCLLCPDVLASEVHHLSYDPKTLLGMRLFNLVGLCSCCHSKIEMDGKRKRTLSQANRTLRFLASQTEKGTRWLNKVNQLTKQARKEDFKHIREQKAQQKRKRGIR